MYASSSSSSNKKSILGFGSCGIDYLARLDGDDFPRPDGKYRASDLVICGGGNVSNGLTAAARLGASCALVSKLGSDANGRAALAELETDGVECESVFIEGDRSPFTYILIAKDDKEGVTRTCVHTPGVGLSREELANGGVADGLVEKWTPDLVYFDGRLTEAAIELARAAKKRENVKVLVEAERLRENLEELLTYADVVMTSKTYPGDAESSAKTLGDAMTRMFARLPNARVMVTTLGARGAVALVREASTTSVKGGAVEVLDDVMERLELSVGLETGLEIPGESASSAAITVMDASGDARVENVRVIFAPAMKLREDEVVDTTGCGDAFIGAFAYAACEDDFDVGETMRLCSYVAAKKCRDVGARRGLPRADEIPSALRRQTSTRRSALFAAFAGFAAAFASPDTRAEAAASADMKTLTELFNRAMTSPSYEEAESLWTKAIEIAPPNSPALSAAYSNRGTLRLQYSEWLGAVEDLQKSVDLDGDHPDPLALNNLGNSKGALGRWDEAMADFLEASRFEDMRAIAQANYALAAFQTGRQDLATSTARKLLRKDPEFLDMRAALSAFLWAAGDQAEAEAEWTYLCKSGRGFGAKESAESKRDDGALAYSATLLSQQFAQIGAELTGGVKEAGLDTPCRLYKSTDVVANRWPPRATAALDAFLRVRRDGQALDYDGEVKTFDFPIRG